MANEEAIFRRRTLDIMEGFTGAVSMKLDAQTEATTATAESVNRLTKAVEAQTQNIGRLERGIAQMVAESAAQRETINNLIKLATALVAQKAS